MEYQSSEGFELLAILLVSHGSGGSHLLFKYPFTNRDQGNGNNVNAALIHQCKYVGVNPLIGLELRAIKCENF